MKIHEDWSGPDPVSAHAETPLRESREIPVERRVFTRAECGLQAILEYGGDHFASEIVNVSLSGTLINTGAAPRKGSRVAVTFTLPGTDPLLEVHCVGHVVRSDRRGVGVEFTEMSEESFRLLQEVVASQCGPVGHLDEELADLDGLVP